MITSCANCGAPFEAIGADHGEKQHCTACSSTADVFELRGEVRRMRNALERSQKTIESLKAALAKAQQAVCMDRCAKPGHVGTCIKARKAIDEVAS